MIFPFPSSPHCAPTRIVFAIEIENGQKIFPMHPAGHTRDCRQRICYGHAAARDFAFVDVSLARARRYGSRQK
jgi:hypothetical protein